MTEECGGPLEGGMALCLHPARKWETWPYSHKKLNSASNQTEQDTDFPLEPAGRDATQRHLDFSVVRPLLNFSPTLR